MRTHIRKKISAAILAALVVFILWTAWANAHPAVTEYTVESERLPTSFDGFRIVQVSDLHNATFGKDDRQLFRTLERADADIIVLTGDLIDSTHTDVTAAVEFVRRAVQLAPCYYITGNHEAWVGEETYAALEAQLLALGVNVLHDESVSVERGGELITLVGIDDPAFAEQHGGGAALSMSPERLRALTPDPNTFTVLLSHRPEYFPQYVRAGFDLVLSGHAHGGQFRLPLIGGLVAPDQGLFPKYDAGTFTDGTTTMIVSRGVGNSVIPVRVNNRPEIGVVEFSA